MKESNDSNSENYYQVELNKILKLKKQWSISPKDQASTKNFFSEHSTYPHFITAFNKAIEEQSNRDRKFFIGWIHAVIKPERTEEKSQFEPLIHEMKTETFLDYTLYSLQKNSFDEDVIFKACIKKLARSNRPKKLDELISVITVFNQNNNFKNFYFIKIYKDLFTDEELKTTWNAIIAKTLTSVQKNLNKILQYKRHLLSELYSHLITDTLEPENVARLVDDESMQIFHHQSLANAFLKKILECKLDNKKDVISHFLCKAINQNYVFADQLVNLMLEKNEISLLNNIIFEPYIKQSSKFKSNSTSNEVLLTPLIRRSNKILEPFLDAITKQNFKRASREHSILLSIIKCICEDECKSTSRIEGIFIKIIAKFDHIITNDNEKIILAGNNLYCEELECIDIAMNLISKDRGIGLTLFLSKFDENTKEKIVTEIKEKIKNNEDTKKYSSREAVRRLHSIMTSEPVPRVDLGHLFMLKPEDVGALFYETKNCTKRSTKKDLLHNVVTRLPDNKLYIIIEKLLNSVQYFTNIDNFNARLLDAFLSLPDTKNSRLLFLKHAGENIVDAFKLNAWRKILKMESNPSGVFLVQHLPQHLLYNKKINDVILSANYKDQHGQILKALSKKLGWNKVTITEKLLQVRGRTLLKNTNEDFIDFLIQQCDLSILAKHIRENTTVQLRLSQSTPTTVEKLINHFIKNKEEFTTLMAADQNIGDSLFYRFVINNKEGKLNQVITNSYKTLCDNSTGNNDRKETILDFLIKNHTDRQQIPQEILTDVEAHIKQHTDKYFEHLLTKSKWKDAHKLRRLVWMLTIVDNKKHLFLKPNLHFLDFLIKNQHLQNAKKVNDYELDNGKIKGDDIRPHLIIETTVNDFFERLNEDELDDFINVLTPRSLIWLIKLSATNSHDDDKKSKDTEEETKYIKLIKKISENLWGRHLRKPKSPLKKHINILSYCIDHHETLHNVIFSMGAKTSLLVHLLKMKHGKPGMTHIRTIVNNEYNTTLALLLLRLNVNQLAEIVPTNYFLQMANFFLKNVLLNTLNSDHDLLEDNEKNSKHAQLFVVLLKLTQVFYRNKKFVNSHKLSVLPLSNENYNQLTSTIFHAWSTLLLDKIDKLTTDDYKTLFDSKAIRTTSNIIFNKENTDFLIRLIQNGKTPLFNCLLSHTIDKLTCSLNKVHEDETLPLLSHFTKHFPSNEWKDTITTLFNKKPKKLERIFKEHYRIIVNMLLQHSRENNVIFLVKKFPRLKQLIIHFLEQLQRSKPKESISSLLLSLKGNKNASQNLPIASPIITATLIDNTDKNTQDDSGDKNTQDTNLVSAVLC
jgi:hypothetical protein